MSNMVKITFGIPCYNSERTIRRLISCFKDTQSFKYEIIIIDDGSTDETFKICKDIIHSAQCDILVFKQRHNGVSAARNNIIKRANGEWVSFIDSDDLIDFNMYEKIIIENLRDDIDYLICSEKSIPRKPSLSWLISNEIINSSCAKFYRSDVLNKNHILFLDDLDLGEDLVFNIEYFNKCNSYKVVDDYPYYYVKKVDSLTTKQRNNKYEVLMSLNDNCSSLLTGKIQKDQSIKKSLEFIRIKNCASCVRTHMGDDVIAFIKKLKSDNPRKYLLMNSIKDTVLYNMWYLMPKRMIAFVMKGYK